MTKKVEEKRMNVVIANRNCEDVDVSEEVKQGCKKTTLSNCIDYLDKHPWASVLIVAVLYSIAHYCVFTYYQGYLDFFNIDSSNLSFDLRATINMSFTMLISSIIICLYSYFLIRKNNEVFSLISLLVSAICFFVVLITGGFFSNNYVLIFISVILLFLMVMSVISFLYTVVIWVYKKIKKQTNEKKESNENPNKEDENIILATAIISFIIGIISLIVIPYSTGKSTAENTKQFKLIEEKQMIVVYETQDYFLCVDYEITAENELILYTNTSDKIEKTGTKTIEKTFEEVTTAEKGQ